MPFKKGLSGNYNGRPKGVGNKIETKLKEVIHKLLEDKSQNLETWIDLTAKKDPARAAGIYLKLCEFVIPKIKHTTLETTIQENITGINYSFLPDEALKEIDAAREP